MTLDVTDAPAADTAVTFDAPHTTPAIATHTPVAAAEIVLAPAAVAAEPPPVVVQAAEPAPVVAAAPTPAPAAVVYSSANSAPAPVDQIPDLAPTREAGGAPRARRPHAAAASEPLVFIETAAGKTQATDVQAGLAEIEPQRRSTPRPRRERVVANDPLEVVETKAESTPQA